MTSIAVSCPDINSGEKNERFLDQGCIDLCLADLQLSRKGSGSVSSWLRSSFVLELEEGVGLSGDFFVLSALGMFRSLLSC